MTKYERIRQEIIAIERELAVLRTAVRDGRQQEAFRQICDKNQMIRDSFADIKQAI